jgi:hypothetical protein
VLSVKCRVPFNIQICRWMKANAEAGYAIGAPEGNSQRTKVDQPALQNIRWKSMLTPEKASLESAALDFIERLIHNSVNAKLGPNIQCVGRPYAPGDPCSTGSGRGERWDIG